LPQEQEKPYRLAGLCKNCHQLRFGYLLYDRGPFICYECAEKAAKKIPVNPTTTNAPGVLYFSYTFTTSNSTSNTLPSHADYYGLHFDQNNSGESQS